VTLSKTVNEPNTAYTEAQPARDEADTLLGGTESMREAGTVYLPKNERESDPKYKARIQRSFLYNVFKSTVNAMSGKPFEKPASVEPLEEFYEAFNQDVDKQGVNLESFAKDVLKQMLAKGMTFIFIDAPVIDSSQATSRQDEIDRGIRPYWTHIHAENLIGWDIDVINGVQTLVRIRVRESVMEPFEDFGEKEVDQIRVTYPDRFEVWRKTSDQSKEWSIYDEGLRASGVITLVAAQADRSQFMASELPLKPLAEKNIEHWQSSSDQRNILHLARIPILFAKAVDIPQDEQGRPTGEISTGSIVTASSEKGDLKWVELSGDGSIVQGQADVERLVDEMESLGGQLMFRKAGSSKTATEETIKESKGDSVLHSIISNLESALDQAYVFTDLLRGQGTAPPRVTLYRDFSIHNPNLMSAEDLLKAYSLQAIPYEVYVEEMKARGLRTKLTAEEMQDAMGDEVENLPDVTE